MSATNAAEQATPDNAPEATLAQIALCADFPHAVIARRAREVHDGVLTESDHLDGPNFRRFHPDDLRLIFEHTDRLTLGGRLRRGLAGRPLDFVISKRMTSAAGKLTTRVRRERRGVSSVVAFEIAVSSQLLFEGYQLPQAQLPATTVVGIPCADRLAALQRVLEHEMVHLTEMLLFGSSNCSQSRFQSIAARVFGHTGHRHALMTPAARAAAVGIHPGDRVRFTFEGSVLDGQVISTSHRRATVLVKHPGGSLHTDGGRYLRYGVSATSLERLP